MSLLNMDKDKPIDDMKFPREVWPSANKQTNTFGNKRKIVNNKDEFNELYSKEEPEREMTLNQLKFNSQLNMEKFGDSIESRRFVSHNDSCMSFLQFQIRKESIYINVIWRSSEVSKMLPVDFKSLKYIIKEYINWFYKFGYILNNKIVLDIQLNNCHIYC